MTLTGEWIKDETGALVMKWTAAHAGSPAAPPSMPKLAAFPVIFADDHRTTAAIATVTSHPPAALRRARDVSDDALSLSR
jgi:hypothetical protein